MRRQLSALAVLAVLLTGCGSQGDSRATSEPSPSSCTPPPGGRCAADVAWHGPIDLASDGRTLSGSVLCGGSLHTLESAEQVDIRLHVGAVSRGAMLCARVDVSVQLSEQLGSRPVYEAVSGARIRIVRAYG